MRIEGGPRPRLARPRLPARSPWRIALLALLLGACDGGIFGTGDGSDGLPIDAGQPGTTNVAPDGGGGDTGTSVGAGPEDSGGDTGGGASGDTGGEADGGGDTNGETAPPQGGAGGVPFTNTLVTGATAAPRVRLVNASGARTTLLGGEGAPVLPDGVAPGATSAYAAVPLDTRSLVVLAGAADADATSRYLLEPLVLGTSSVTTLVARDAASPDGGISVVPLRTLTSPDDPAQALVRVVLAAVADPDGTRDAETFTLVPGGSAPGGVEVTFDAVSFSDAPSSGYSIVPAGDYRLSGSAGEVSSLPVSFAPDTVYTLVIAGRGRVLGVVDGAPGGR